MKNAYRSLQENAEEDAGGEISGFWRKLWRLKIPLKMKLFLWQAATGCLPTKFQLQTRHVPIDAICPFCLSEVESIVHILVNCPLAQECWNKLGYDVDLQVSGSFISWLNLVFDRFKGDRRREIVMLCWSIWRSRNALVCPVGLESKGS